MNSASQVPVDKAEVHILWRHNMRQNQKNEAEKVTLTVTQWHIDVKKVTHWCQDSVTLMSS